MRIAIVHEWLTVFAGAERVLEQMLRCFPDSDLFCVVDFLTNEQRGFIGEHTSKPTFIQRLPFASTKYRSYLPLMPLAIEQHDLSGYDVVISSSHAVAKGVITGPDQLHICMCYSPIRYAWDLQHQYLRESGLDRGIKSWLVRWMLHRIRLWDVRTANGVDEFIAISNFVGRRIQKVYRRESVTIYPPVEVDHFPLVEKKDEFFLTASRLVPYKCVGLIVEAFSALKDKRLVVIGDGPEYKKIESKAGPNVELLGYQSTGVLKDYMQRAKAFIFAAEEDFGIIPLEAQACGTPVIAYGKGGVLETIRGIRVGQGIGELSEGVSGVFFDQQNVTSICDAVVFFEKYASGFSPRACRNNAERFSPDRFRREFSEFVGAAMNKMGIGTTS